MEEDFQRVTQNLFFAGDGVQPQETNTEEGMEKQQTLKALSHASFPFSETLVVYSACSLWGRSHGGEGRGASFNSLRKWLLSALLHVQMGTLQGNPKGCMVPEGCAIGKIWCFAQLEKCNRRALNHVHWWERHFYPGKITSLVLQIYCSAVGGSWKVLRILVWAVLRRWRRFTPALGWTTVRGQWHDPILDSLTWSSSGR